MEVSPFGDGIIKSLSPMLEMKLWLESDEPDYRKAIEERRAELRAKGEAKKRERRIAFGARRKPPTNYVGKMSLSNVHRDLFDGLLSVVPRGRGKEFEVCANPPKETGQLSDSEAWNGYEWERI